MQSSSALAIGVAIGVLIGGGAMYLGLERPWRSGPAATRPTADAGVKDSGKAPVAKGKKKKPRGGKRRGGDSAGDQGDGDEVAAPIVLSAADRKMSWKGDSVERPPASLDMSAGGDEGRALSNGEIQATISRDGDALTGCIGDALDGAPFTGEITVKMLVDGDGNASKARVHGPAFMHANGLSGCIKRGARKMGFPATGGYTVVTVPFPISY